MAKTHKEFLESKNVKTLRGYVRDFNLHLSIKKYSTMKKKDLVDVLHKKTKYANNKLSVKVEVGELKPQPPKPRVKKPKPPAPKPPAPKPKPQQKQTQDYIDESDNLKFYENKKKVMTQKIYETITKRIDDLDSKQLPIMLRIELEKRLKKLDPNPKPQPDENKLKREKEWEEVMEKAKKITDEMDDFYYKIRWWTNTSINSGRRLQQLTKGVVVGGEWAKKKKKDLEAIEKIVLEKEKKLYLQLVNVLQLKNMKLTEDESAKRMKINKKWDKDKKEFIKRVKHINKLLNTNYKLSKRDEAEFKKNQK